jgi:plastocyanin
MRRWLVLVTACLAIGLVVAGCGGDDDDDGGGGGNGGGAAQDQGGGGGGAGGGGAEVSMRNIQFQPQEITIDAGETVTWTNDEAVAHDVEGSTGDFSSGPPGGLEQGDAFSETFDEPGTFEYVCRVHAPGMSGTVTVR